MDTYIRRIKVSQFKALVDFELHLEPKFNCLIGLNGAGKSSVLQLFSFISAIFNGDIETWLRDAGWQKEELGSKFKRSKKIEIELDLCIKDRTYRWSAVYDIDAKACGVEVFGSAPYRQIKSEYVDVKRRFYKPKLIAGHSRNPIFRTGSETVHFANGGKRVEVDFNYQGSILAALKNEHIAKHAQLWALLTHVRQLKCFDQVSPSAIKKGMWAGDGLGPTGEGLIGQIHQMTTDDKEILVQQLTKYFLNISDIATKVDKNTGLQLEVVESWPKEDGSLQRTRTNILHANDGLVRLLLIVAAQREVRSLMVFDEIENGVNPEITSKLVEALVSAPQQVLVTTHSPMVLNYIPDELAKKGVSLIYKNQYGHTKSCKFFAQPELADSLEYFGPGEAMLSVNLEDIAKKAEGFEG